MPQGAILCFENSANILHQKTVQGYLRPPEVKAWKADMETDGYEWMSRTLSCQEFLLPQRRLRAWSTASFGEEQPDLEALVTCTLDALKSFQRFTAWWQEGLPKDALAAGLRARIAELQDKWKFERSEWKDLYVDTQASAGGSLDHALGMSTPVRPASSIYATRLGRYLNSSEHFSLHLGCLHLEGTHH